MSRRGVQTVILCEDLQHGVFVRRFLKQTGRAVVGRITVRHTPKGRGCGAQFVLDHFPEEVRAFRRQSHHLSLCLIVILDADKLSVQERVRQLEGSLAAAGQSGRTSEERIVILIPKRHIETWIRYLNGHDFDESTPYPKLALESECMPAVRKLAQVYPHGIEKDAPDSLQRACVEAGRCTK